MIVEFLTCTVDVIHEVTALCESQSVVEAAEEEEEEEDEEEERRGQCVSGFSHSDA